MTVSMRDFVPANQLAGQYGVKVMAFGPPGGGKTPLIMTAPRPAMLVLEPGMLSMRQEAAKGIAAYSAIDDLAKADDWFTWAFNSAEAKNFDTLCVDSWSEYAEICLRHYQKTDKHGQAAYGKMLQHVMSKARSLFYYRYKHVYLICKEGKIPEDGMMKSKPVFPGQALNVDMPHLYDEIWRVGDHQIAGVMGPIAGGLTPSILCRTSGDLFARDRSGRCNQYEPKDLNALFRKIMA